MAPTKSGWLVRAETETRETMTPAGRTAETIMMWITSLQSVEPEMASSVPIQNMTAALWTMMAANIYHTPFCDISSPTAIPSNRWWTEKLRIIRKVQRPDSISLLALASSFLLPLLSLTAVQSVEEL